MLELADVIRQLRSELARGFAASSYEELSFELGPIEFEVMVGVASDSSGSGRMRFMVVELGNEAKAHGATQRLSLTLQPKLTAGSSEVIISDDFAEER